MSSKEQFGDALRKSNNCIAELRRDILLRDKLIDDNQKEIERLRNVCCCNAKEIQSLEKMIRKTKKWYQIIIWQK
jgi:hypothetical protein